MLEDILPTYRGKVREIYDLGDKLLIYSTDRISAFDVVFNELIPNKGKILNELSIYWFRDFKPIKSILPNHLIDTEVEKYPEPFNLYLNYFRGRSMLVRKAKRIDFECVVRGYLTGSAWKEYKKFGRVNGIRLPKGLRESEQLKEPIFTPATKSSEGHDENITFDFMINAIGWELANKLKEVSIRLFEVASDYLYERGLILADTKFEFGLIEDELLLIDEVFTPDSSRFWLVDEYRTGERQNPFDKQFLRAYLESTGWNKEPPPPTLPYEVIFGILERYKTAFYMITGKEPEFLEEDYSEVKV